MKNRPLLRCVSYSLNAHCNDFKDSFNSPGTSRLHKIETLIRRCHVDKNLDSIHTTWSSPRGSFDHRISALSELIGFFALIPRSPHSCSYPCRRLALAHWKLRALVSESRRETVSVSRFTPGADACSAWPRNLIDVCSRHHSALHWTDGSQHHPLALLWV